MVPFLIQINEDSKKFTQFIDAFSNTSGAAYSKEQRRSCDPAPMI